MIRYNFGLAGAVSVLALASATIAQAQEAPQPQTSVGEVSADPAGEIIVTAQRRAEALERTPVAISVVGGAALAQRAIVSEADLPVASPGLTIRAG